MVSNIFVNLPVTDLERTKRFFADLGFTFNPHFTDEKAACMVMGENLFAMLLVRPFFQTFTPKAVADAKKSSEVLVALSVESRNKVDELVDKALKAGAGFVRPPEDHGWMYSRSFEDPDGHIWEFFWADPTAIEK
jgi:uncharacterized protein